MCSYIFLKDGKPLSNASATGIISDKRLKHSTQLKTIERRLASYNKVYGGDSANGYIYKGLTYRVQTVQA